MSAHLIYDHAPLGALIRYSDGTPKPPTRFTKKLAAWKNRNGLGRLARKEPHRDRATYTLPATITLHEGNVSSGAVILVTVMRTYTVDSDLTFEVVGRPTIGMVRVLQDCGDTCELLHLAESRAAADVWLAEHRYSQARMEDVTADEVAADVVEGRAA